MNAIKISGAAGVIYSQITVDATKECPDRHSLKESRTLANMAEGVALGFETKKTLPLRNGETIAAGQKVLFVDKVKDGPPKRLHAMNWDEDFACFRMTRDPMEENYEAFNEGLPPLPAHWNERAEA